MDRQLIPPFFIEIAYDKSGRRRAFADEAGFGIVCAARLLDLGLPHPAIRCFVEYLLNRRLLGLPFAAICPDTIAELGDQSHFRMAFGPFDSGWIGHPNRSWKPDPKFKPTVIVRLEVGLIWDELFRSAKPD